MGKKSKANLKKAPLATAAAVTTARTTDAAETELGKFLESTFFIKAQTFVRKGNVSKAKKNISTRNQKWLCSLFERIFHANSVRWRDNRK